MASTAVRGMVRLGHRRVQAVTAAEKMLNLRPSTLYFASTAVRGMVRSGHRKGHLSQVIRRGPAVTTVDMVRSRQWNGHGVTAVGMVRTMEEASCYSC